MIVTAFESEEALLSACLIPDYGHEAIDAAIDAGLSVEDFSKRHAPIFTALKNLVESERPVELLSLASELDSLGALERIGGPAYLSALAGRSGTHRNAAFHAASIIDAAHRNRIRQTCLSAANRSSEAGTTHIELIDQVEKEFNRITNRSGHENGRMLNPQDVHQALTELDQRIDNRTGIVGVPTGFTEIDNITGGWKPGNLIVLAGRPSMGKTALAINMALRTAIPALREASASLPAHGTVFFSLEMPRPQLLDRLIAQTARVSLHKITTGRGLESHDRTKISHAADVLQSSKIFIRDDIGVTASQVRTGAKKALRMFNGLNFKAGLIIVDYLQIMGMSKEKGLSRERQVAEASMALKGIAMELKTPVLVLSQLNRTLQTRSDKRPQLSDLRDSGAIEQDADLIMFIHREEYYQPEKEHLKGRAELIIAKNRNGPTGNIRMLWDPITQNFRSSYNDLE
jgi:replicative DNA helicase